MKTFFRETKTNTRLDVQKEKRIYSTPERLELSRAEPNSLAGCRLNHSAKVPPCLFETFEVV